MQIVLLEDKTQHDTTIRYNTLNLMFVTQMRTNYSTRYIDTIHVNKKNAYQDSLTT